MAGSATLDITPVNDAPTTTPVTLAAIAEDSGARLITQAELLANAARRGRPGAHRHRPGDLRRATAALVDNGNGTWSYTPAANDDTSVRFSYTITDGMTDGVAAAAVAGSATLDITPVNDAPNDLALTITAVPSDTGLPGNTNFGQFSVSAGADPDGGGAYAYSMLSLNVTDLNGNVQTDTTPDLAVSGTGVLSTGNGNSALQSGRIYEADIQVAQGSATYHETFSHYHRHEFRTTPSMAWRPMGDDVIYGLQSGGANGVDVILAGTGNDTVFGQAGKDEIHGGAGNDVLYGGGGNDTFVFDTALNAATNVDLIADFASGSDKIGLSNASGLFDQIATGPLAATAFDIIGDATAATGVTRIAYDPSTGALYYDADGGGTGAAIQFATLGSASHPTISATDFVIGNPPPGA